MVSTSALAATGSADKETTSEETTVKYAVTEGYEWTIHSEIDFGADKGANSTEVKGTSSDGNKVEVTKNVIPNGKKLKITVAGSGDSNAFTIKNNDGVTLDYTVNNGDTGASDLIPGGEVLSVAAGTNNGEKTMVFTLTTGAGTAEVAGSYSGTVTYTAEVVNQ